MFWFIKIILKIHTSFFDSASNIDKPKYTGLFIFTFIFFISIARKSSGNPFLCGNKVLKLIYFYFYHLLLIQYLCFLTFSNFFPKPKLFINLMIFFSNHFLFLFFVQYSFQCMPLKCFLIKLNCSMYFLKYQSLIQCFFQSSYMNNILFFII